MAVEEVKTQRRRGSLLLKIAVFAFAAFLIAMLVGQSASIGAKEAELATIEAQIEAQRTVNEGLRYELNTEATDEYAERVARREFGYVYPGERVFYNVGGNN